jgi:succinyl-CoA synthetase beta subunit
MRAAGKAAFAFGGTLLSMKLHEYQAKKLLAERGVPVPSGAVAETPQEARDAAQRIRGPVVVKAQVHVAGRGKAGGIRRANTPAEAEEVAAAILSSRLKGLVVRKVLVEEALDLSEEYYLGLTVDREKQRNVVMVSAMGGVDIEEVAAKRPEDIARVWLTPDVGLRSYHERSLFRRAGLEDKGPELGKFLRALCDIYVSCDASLAEINPLVITRGGQAVAADAKIDIDDNALFRHPELEAQREEAEEDPLEAEAHRRGLQYVRLEGKVGVMGNGAGLVMATVDEVKRAGGLPANFLDIGGGARAELVRTALELLLSDERVRSVLINVFGGITRCDEVASGVLEAAGALNAKVPIVVRLTGTNEKEGRQLLEGSGLFSAATMEEAAAMAVRAAGGGVPT